MRGSRWGLGAVAAACAMAAPAGATHHKAHSAPAHHKAEPKHPDSRHKPPAHHDAPRPAVAAGATSVPAGGIKLYCGPGKAPLMVRKMTQGAGTTVTVICR